MNHVRLVALLTGMLLAAPLASAQTIDLNTAPGRQVGDGASAGGRAGTSLHAGDLTGDFYNKELIIGSPGESSERGTVRIRFGGRIGNTDFTTNEVDAVITGGVPGDHFGADSDAGHVTRREVVVVASGPINPTPRDLVVGAPDAQAGRGEVYLFAGPFATSSQRTTANATYRIIGRANGRLGTDIETADLNGDGFREIIAAEPGTGCIHVVDVRSATTAVLDLSVASAAMTICGAGNRIALTTGDISADGIFDLVIGAPANEGGRGAVYVFRGRSGALPAVATVSGNFDARLVGRDVGDELGSSVAIGDVDDDADPTEDLVIGVPGGDGPGNTRTNAGEVFVIWGAVGMPAALVPNLTLLGAASGHTVGTRVVAGDVTRDGPYEVVALAPGANSGAGDIYAYFGRHRYEFPTSGFVDLATGADRRVVGARGVGPLESLVIWEANGRGGEEIVAAVPSATTSAGAAAGRLYIALSPQPDLSATTFDLNAVQCESPSGNVVISNPSAVAIPWQFYTETPWLRASTATGNAVVGASGQFRIVAMTQGLAPGTYTGNATILSRSRNLTLDVVVWVQVTVTAASPMARTASVDFTGDGCGDLGIFRGSSGTWRVSGQPDSALGAVGDLPVPGDYDGNFLAEAAVYRRSNSTWYFQGSEVRWGVVGDIPVPGDYDGDGRTDIAVYRPSTSTWLIRGQAPIAWGSNGELPVPADYDGDGRTDLAVYARGTGMWRIRNQSTVTWGSPFDIPVPADYNGDGRADIAVFRRSAGTWYVKDQMTQAFGDAQTLPFALDVNRDGRDDLVSFHPRTGAWRTYDLVTGATNTTTLGAAGDLPLTQGWHLLATNPSTNDFNADGRTDMVWQNDTSRQAVAWYMGGANGNVMDGWNYLTSFDVSGWTVVATADFNSDGALDLVWQNDATRQAVVWYMGGPERNVMQSWNWLTAIETRGWKIVAATDFNGDGKPDLLWQNDVTRQASIWFMGGAEGNRWDTWTWLAASDVPSWRIVGTADINDDGRTDVIWQHDATRHVSVWYLTGAKGDVFTGWDYLNPTVVAGWHVVGTKDINADGTPDLLWQNDSTRAVTVWIMGGTRGTTMVGWAWMSTIDVRGWSAIVR
jgi:hypothetical protein